MAEFRKIKKPTCVGFFVEPEQLLTLRQVQVLAQEQEREQLQQRKQQPERKQLQQPEQQQVPEQQVPEQQLLYHKRTKTKPIQQRSERTVSFRFLQLIDITGVLNLFGNPFAKVSLVANGAAFYHCHPEMSEYIERVL